MRISQRLKNRERSVISNAYMTAKQFLSIDSTNGYFTKDEFDGYISSLRESEVDQLEEFILNLKDGFKMFNRLVTRTDQSNRDYIYCEVRMPNAAPGYKVVTEGGMFNFLKDLQMGKVKVNFTLSELIDELEA